jgi:ubiquinone/menaquinone biosynthesis C-methylase UbiE
MPNGRRPRILKISGGNSLLDPYFILGEVGLGAGMKVADLGCGAVGHFVIPAGKIVGERGVVYAVDILKSVLAAVLSRAKLEGVTNVKTVWSNLEIDGATEIQPQSLDFVLLINTLWQIKKNETTFREAVRLIKNGGKLVVVEWWLGEAPLGPPSERRISKDYVRDLAKKYGLTEEKEFKAGPYHYGLVFKK